ncbi:S-layer homology domain-containing protein [Calditerricola satsumensis]|uniref:S-layer homology domain-containing protein n=1 Tax=Calditerricola satsumensis TaxID=373054 RepID=UPI0006D06642|nr:S-layer homology domain-containing protein [Calditerricola satsumensis]
MFKNNAILFEYTGKDGFLKRLVFTERLLFSDVTSNHWAKDAIEYLAIKGILKGRNENFFEPEGKITRAEFAAVLVRILPNLPCCHNKSGNGFDDGQSNFIAQ